MGLGLLRMAGLLSAATAEALALNSDDPCGAPPDDSEIGAPAGSDGFALGVREAGSGGLSDLTTGGATLGVTALGRTILGAALAGVGTVASSGFTCVSRISEATGWETDSASAAGSVEEKGSSA